MKMLSVQSLSFGDISCEYDLVVAASGYESRARFLAEHLPRQSEPDLTKIVFSFEEHSSACARIKNDAVFRKTDFVSIPSSGGSDTTVLSTLFEISSKFRRNNCKRVLIDITSMTRAWYGAIVRWLMQLEGSDRFEVDFVYVPAQFTPPPLEYPPNRIVAPVRGFSGNTLPDKPTALIVGLGYDYDRAVGLKDHLDPQLTVLFYASPASDERFTPHVLKSNESLIEEVGEDQLFTYPFIDGCATYQYLESFCKGLIHDWRVVLCSLGPKIFGLNSFLVASVLRDVSIWRVSADNFSKPFDHKPIQKPVVIRTVWQ